MAGTGPALDRRELLKLGVFSSAALALPAERLARTQVALSNRIAESALPPPFTIPFKMPPVLVPDCRTESFDYYTVHQRQATAEILPGKLTDIWGYNGIAPGPTIVATQGRPAVVQQINDLPAVHPTLRYNVATSTHLHGSCSKPQYDGYASDITDGTSWKDYVYPNVQAARTLWYHDHAVHMTAPNIFMGLAAMYVLHDTDELSLPIPHGAYDVPFVLTDAMFEDNGALLFDANDDSGFHGDVLLVNGVPWPAMPVERRKYRFRVLNASVSRSYGLQLDSGEPLIVIGTDGGLVPHPMAASRLKVGMAERYEVVIDFSKYQIGQRVVMQNVSPDNNIDFATTGVVMAFDVVAETSDTTGNEVPLDLNPGSATMALAEADAVRTRHLEFKRHGGQWTINETTWDDVVNSGFTKVLANPGFGDVEIWELANPHGGWFHPVHIHLVDFKILDRNGRPPFGYEKGPKDVVYVGENETVRVIMRFEHEQGRYMMHCHNLVHEDHNMMAQFLVGVDSPAYDPIHAAPATHKPARPVCDPHDESPAGVGDPIGTSPPASSLQTCTTTKRRVAKKTKRRVVEPKRRKHKNPVVKAKAAAAKGQTTSASCAPAKRKPVTKRKRKPAPKPKAKRKRRRGG
jgi:FtsP/CotA-like multicopper oxidase with cupredoxin domain